MHWELRQGKDSTSPSLLEQTDMAIYQRIFPGVDDFSPSTARKDMAISFGSSQMPGNYSKPFSLGRPCLESGMSNPPSAHLFATSDSISKRPARDPRPLKATPGSFCLSWKASTFSDLCSNSLSRVSVTWPGTFDEHRGDARNGLGSPKPPKM